MVRSASILVPLLVATLAIGAVTVGPVDARPKGPAKAHAKAAKGKKSKSSARPVAKAAPKALPKIAVPDGKLAATCKTKQGAKTPKCKAFAAAQRKSEAQRKLAVQCRQKAHRGTKACKALRAAQARHRSHGSICGRRYGTAKKNEKVASFARRYRVAESRVRDLNCLGAGTKKLKGGKRYVVFKSPHEGVVLHNGVLL